MLHAISTQCVACDLHTIVPGPLERMCWRRFVVQWDCKKSLIAPLNEIIIIIIIITITKQYNSSSGRLYEWIVILEMKPTTRSVRKKDIRDVLHASKPQQDSHWPASLSHPVGSPGYDCDTASGRSWGCCWAAPAGPGCSVGDSGLHHCHETTTVNFCTHHSYCMSPFCGGQCAAPLPWDNYCQPLYTSFLLYDAHWLGCSVSCATVAVQLLSTYI